jgi:valyl-tRNA synthetase
MDACWPPSMSQNKDLKSAKKMQTLQEIVTKLRTIRSEMGIPPTQSIQVIVRPTKQETAKLIKDHELILKYLNSRVDGLTYGLEIPKPQAAASAVVPGAELFVPLEGLIDFAKEKGRLEKELETIKSDVDRLNKKLANGEFLTNAPAEEIQKTKDRLSESLERSKHLEENILTLSR